MSPHEKYCIVHVGGPIRGIIVGSYKVLAVAIDAADALQKHADSLGTSQIYLVYERAHFDRIFEDADDSTEF